MTTETNVFAVGGASGAKRRRGFTLIELLTVIAIIGILAALIFLGIGSVRATAKRAQCASNLRQLATAGLLYTEDNKGNFPRRVPASATPINPFAVGGAPTTLSDAQIKALPLNAYTADPRGVWRCPADTGPRSTRTPPLASWGDKPFYEVTGTSYYYNSYVGTSAGVLNGSQRASLAFLRIDQIREPSRLVFFADQDARVFGSAGDNWRNLTLWTHVTPDTMLKANIAFVDGSVRFMEIVAESEAKFTFYNE